MSAAAQTERHRLLAAAIGSVRERLGGGGGDRAGAAPTPPGRLERLASLFGLSAFERDLLLLCAGLELDAQMPAACREAHGLPFATFGLALAHLAEPHWSAVTPAAPLRAWRMIEVEGGGELVAARLRIDERIVHHLLGLDPLDQRLAPFLRRAAGAPWVPESQLERIRLLAAELGEMPPPIVHLDGADERDAAAFAGAVCDRLSLGLHRLRADDLPAAGAERDTFALLWRRECLLAPRAVLLLCDDDPQSCRRAVQLAEPFHPLFVHARDGLPAPGRPVRRVALGRPGAAEQHQAWRRLLADDAHRLNGELEHVASHFSLGVSSLEQAAATARRQLRRGADPARALWSACRAASRPRLRHLAQEIEPAAEWDDLVLPGREKATLRDIAAHVRNRRLVYEDWGFGRKCSRGRGVSALFHGDSGTGKTMAAEVLARTLDLGLYRIDLSAVVSKYIGETEKNLRAVFDAAEDGGAVLLFDEADALFGKRSEVRDSHDRYANIEVGYLLQRMESYRGLAVLTTNMKTALDRAFLRRLRFVVSFPFPSAEQRLRIWERMFPQETRTDGLDLERLARLNVAGGSIRNIALGAAFLAADAGQPVRMEHLYRAAQAEYTKIEKPLTASESGGPP